MRSVSSLTPFCLLERVELVLEVLVLDAHGGRAEHVDQAAVAVVGEPRRCRSSWPAPRRSASVRPRLRIVFIMPGIERAAPERTRDEQRVGRRRRTSCRPAASTFLRALVDLRDGPLRGSSCPCS